MTVTSAPPLLLAPQIDDDLTRRQALIGAGGLAALLAGCGTTTPAPAPVPRTVTVEHAGGSTEVPLAPERIVTVDGFVDLQTLLAFGVNPVLAGITPRLAEGFLAGRLDGVTQTADRRIENIEEIAAARPDLILSAEYELDEGRYDLLTGVAPTVLMDRYGSTVDDHLRLVGTFLGREADAERLIEEYRARLEQVRSLVAAGPLATRRVAIVDTYVFDAQIYLYGPGSYAGQTLGAVGVDGLLDLGGTPNGDDFSFGGVLSQELISTLADAELIIRYTYDTADAVLIEDQPGWAELPAVVAGAVVDVDETVWYQDTALTRLARLDDIERIARELT